MRLRNRWVLPKSTIPPVSNHFTLYVHLQGTTRSQIASNDSLQTLRRSDVEQKSVQLARELIVGVEYGRC